MKPKNYAKMAERLSRKISWWASGKNVKVMVEDTTVTVLLARRFVLNITLGPEGGSVDVEDISTRETFQKKGLEHFFGVEWVYRNKVIPWIFKRLTPDPDRLALEEAIGHRTGGKERRQLITFHDKHGDSHYLVGENGPAAVFLAWFKMRDVSGWYCLEPLEPLPEPEPYGGSDSDLQAVYEAKVKAYQERLKAIKVREEELDIYERAKAGDAYAAQQFVEMMGDGEYDSFTINWVEAP